MNSFEFLEDLFFGASDFSVAYSEVTHEELTQLLDFGFEVEIVRGRIILQRNKGAMARLILEDIWFEDEVSDVIEYRFLDKKHAELEIETVYMQDNAKSIKEIREDVLTDWHLNEKELEQIKKDDADLYQERKHPDDRN